jgi:hypothetical protein
MFKNKSNWPSVATLRLHGWVIKVNGDQQQLRNIFICTAEGMAKWILLSICLQMWAYVKACWGSRGRAPLNLIIVTRCRWVAKSYSCPKNPGTWWWIGGSGVPEPVRIFLRREKSLACAKNQPTLSRQWPGHYTGTSIQIPDLCRWQSSFVPYKIPDSLLLFVQMWYFGLFFS